MECAFVSQMQIPGPSREWCRGLLEFMDRDDIYEKVNVQQITDLDQLPQL